MAATVSCLYWNPFSEEFEPDHEGSTTAGDFPTFWDSAPAGIIMSDVGIRVNASSGRAVAGEVLTLTGTSGSEVYWLLAGGDLESPPSGIPWNLGEVPVALPLNDTGTFTLFAGYTESPPHYRQVISVTGTYPDWTENSCNAENSHILFWASTVADRVSTDATAYTDTAEALGPAGNDPTRVLALGNNGSVTLTFEGSIINGPGPDFAVFENGLLSGNGSVFAELAFVEVSSDGIVFARFPTASLNVNPVGTYEALEQGTFNGFAGGSPCGYGTLFDLNEILNTPEVLEGLVNPLSITHIRIIDSDTASGSIDSYGRPVQDPSGTWGPSGFDLDGVGIINGATP